MMWFALLALAVLTFLAAVIIAVLGARALSAKGGDEVDAKEAEGQPAPRSPINLAFFLVAAVFLLQACCILVAFIASKIQFGANPWG